jgi:beta-N-acetylhexosaminidase
MKKKKGIIFIILIIIVLILFYLYIPKDTKDVSKRSMTIDEQVQYKLNSMTLEEKIAQMLIVYYTGDTVDETLTDTIKNVGPGGFILMKDNITTYEKIKQFVEDLQSNSDIPMIISIDQEGGIVQRLQKLQDIKPTEIPSMYYLGQTNDKELAYDVGKVMAEELRTVGVNVVFAPVIDVYSNKNNTVIGKRSFGSDVDTVSTMSISLAKGLEDNGVIATYKHFPGHGDTDVDSHVNLPVINKSYDELKELELIPFKNAIENDAKIIMVGHLSLPNITNDNTPSSLSKEIITNILYNDLGYNGLVVTDALNMEALTDNYTDEEIYTKAINAGVDLLLMPNGSKNAIEYIKNNIDEERINKSVEKILKFKYTYLNNYEYLDSSYLNSSEHQEIINKIPVDENV